MLRGAGLVALTAGAGLLLWLGMSSPYSLAELCTRRRPTWILPPFEPARYTAMSGESFVAVAVILAAVSLLVARLVRGLSGRRWAVLALWIPSAVFVGALLPGYPLLSSDIYKYVFDGRILGVYHLNPFLHVPAEFPDDRFYDLVYWKAVVNAHGPIWRVAEAGAALAGGESCRWSVLWMKGWSALAYLGTGALLYATIRPTSPGHAITRTALYLWSPLVMLETAQNGHNDAVAALLALGSVVLARRGRLEMAFLVLAAAALVKPLAVVLGPLLLVAALVRPRRLVAGVSMAAVLTGVAYAPFWAGTATLQGLSRAHIFSASPAEALLLGLQGVGVSLDAAIPLASGAANAAFGLGALAIAWAHFQGRVDLYWGAFATMFWYGLVGAQWFNPWYLLWMMPFACLVEDARARVLGITFSVLALLVYPLQYEATAVMLAVFVPMAALVALAFRSSLLTARPRPRAAGAGT
ncbi:MAG: hypothetical protein U0821_00150 [Chloroflexota bacterium]